MRTKHPWKPSSLAGSGEPSATLSAPPRVEFAALTPEKVQQSDEIYLVAADPGANVKIRDGLLDIKVLERVDSNGLEQWRPVSKEPFPLSASAAASLRRALGLPQAAGASGSVSLDQLLTEICALRRSRPHREREQDSQTIHRPWLHRRGHRPRRQRKGSSHRRDRGCRPRQSDRSRCRHGARRLREHQLPPRAEKSDRAGR